eukprot:3911371-Pyramimonas_sp.AAC.1
MSRNESPGRGSRSLPGEARVGEGVRAPDCDGLFTVHASSGRAQEMLNIVDIKTGFQVVAPIKGKHPGIVAQTLELAWLSWAGVPNSLAADTGREFKMFRLLGGCGAQVCHAAVQSATAERHARAGWGRMERTPAREHYRGGDRD